MYEWTEWTENCGRLCSMCVSSSSVKGRARVTLWRTDKRRVSFYECTLKGQDIAHVFSETPLLSSVSYYLSSHLLPSDGATLCFHFCFNEIRKPGWKSHRAVFRKDLLLLGKNLSGSVASSWFQKSIHYLLQVETGDNLSWTIGNFKMGNKTFSYSFCPLFSHLLKMQDLGAAGQEKKKSSKYIFNITFWE